MFFNNAILKMEKWTSHYINFHKKIYEMKNITTMKRIEVACEKYKSNCVFDIKEEDVIDEIVEEEEDEEGKK